MDERRRWRVKKKYMLMGIAAVLILATMVGGTLAALNTKSEKAVANISIKSVGVTVIGDQPVALADGGEKEPVTIVPGETIVMPKAVQNDIPDGYDVYVKVVIYHAWDTKSFHFHQTPGTRQAPLRSHLLRYSPEPP